MRTVSYNEQTFSKNVTKYIQFAIFNKDHKSLRKNIIQLTEEEAKIFKINR